MVIYKIIVFVPEKFASKIRKVIGEAGAGKIGKYTFWSFSTKGIGRFRPSKGAHPFKGQIEKIEAVPEIRIETVCDQKNLARVLKAIKTSHPYEEPAIDVYKLEALRF